MNQQTWFFKARHNFFLKGSQCQKITPEYREPARAAALTSYSIDNSMMPSREFIDFVEGMGGDIWVESTYSDGCSIYVMKEFAPYIKLRFDFDERCG